MVENIFVILPIFKASNVIFGVYRGCRNLKIGTRNTYVLRHALQLQLQIRNQLRRTGIPLMVVLLTHPR